MKPAAEERQETRVRDVTDDVNNDHETRFQSHLSAVSIKLTVGGARKNSFLYYEF